MNVLIVAEHDNQQLHPQTRSVMGAAVRIGSTADVLVIGHQCVTVAAEAALLAGAGRVRQVDAPHYEHFLAENLAMVVAQMAAAYTHVLFPATAFGKNLAPRVAAMLDVSQVSEVVEILDAQTFVHPIYAGNLLETVRSAEAISVLTIRPYAFSPVALGQTAAPIVAHASGPDMAVSRLVRRELTQSDHPVLANARVVVAGGRGLGSREAFQALLEPLADVLGAAIGATRAAVDCNYIENDAQIGQTGKIVAPDIYIAVGISGAIQHLAGMLDSKLIIAIDKDPEAPIFKVADLSLVGDLHVLVPQLTELLRQ